MQRGTAMPPISQLASVASTYSLPGGAMNAMRGPSLSPAFACGSCSKYNRKVCIFRN